MVEKIISLSIEVMRLIARPAKTAERDLVMRRITLLTLILTLCFADPLLSQAQQGGGGFGGGGGGSSGGFGGGSSSGGFGGSSFGGSTGLGGGGFGGTGGSGGFGGTGMGGSTGGFGQTNTGVGGMGNQQGAGFLGVNNNTQNQFLGRNLQQGQTGANGMMNQNGMTNNRRATNNRGANNQNMMNNQQMQGGMNGGGGANRQQVVIRARQKIAFSHTAPDLPTVSTKLETRLNKMPALKSSKVNLSVSEKGVLILKGQVASAEQAKLAENLARLEPGVRAVQNELTFPDAPSAQ